MLTIVLEVFLEALRFDLGGSKGFFVAILLVKRRKITKKDVTCNGVGKL